MQGLRDCFIIICIVGIIYLTIIRNVVKKFKNKKELFKYWKAILTNLQNIWQENQLLFNIFLILIKRSKFVCHLQLYTYVTVRNEADSWLYHCYILIGALCCLTQTAVTVVSVYYLLRNQPPWVCSRPWSKRYHQYFVILIFLIIIIFRGPKLNSCFLSCLCFKAPPNWRRLLPGLPWEYKIFLAKQDIF